MSYFFLFYGALIDHTKEKFRGHNAMFTQSVVLLIVRPFFVLKSSCYMKLNNVIISRTVVAHNVHSLPL